jgi:glutaredoxin-like protein NrdH
MQGPSIWLYSLSTCSTCGKLKELLAENGCPFESIDLDLLPNDERRELLETLKQLNPQLSFPTLVLGDKVIVGFRRSEILDALKTECRPLKKGGLVNRIRQILGK